MGYLDSTGLSHLWDKIKSALSGKVSYTVTQESNTTNMKVYFSGLVCGDGSDNLIPVIVTCDYGTYRYESMAKISLSQGTITDFYLQNTGFELSPSAVRFRLRKQNYPSANLASKLSSGQIYTRQVTSDVWYVLINYAEIEDANYEQFLYKME